MQSAREGGHAAAGALVTEIVVFSPKEGAPAVEVERAMQNLHGWVREQPGFVSRELLKSGARYVDMVRWRSLADAEAAQAVAMESEVCLAAFALIDESRMEMLHAECVALP